MAGSGEMTADVEGPDLQRSAPPTETQHAGLLVRVLACAPERLLLVFLWFCYVAAAAYVGGFFRPYVVFPVTAAICALTWRLFPRGGRRDARTAIGSVLGLGVGAAWFGLNLPYLAERVQVTRDPDLYTLAALWLRTHAHLDIPVPPVSTGSLGFNLEGGELRPQGNHLVAGVSATAGWLFGESAVFWGNLACGAAALVAIYVMGRRLLGPFWALVPMVALAGSLPMVAFSRALYSEPLAMTFTFLGIALLWNAWFSDRPSEYLLAGISFGAVALSRIDGTLPLIGGLAGLTVAALVAGEGPRRRGRWGAPLVLLGSLPGVLLGFLDLYLHTGSYLTDLSAQLRDLAAVLALVACFALVSAWWSPAGRWHVVTRRIVTGAAVAGAVLAAIGCVVLVSRPWWYVSHGSLDNALVSGIQQREGLPVDGTRLYSEDSMNWLSWYYGWPVVVIGLGGLITWVILGVRTKATHLLWLSALFLPSAILYLTQPSITPDQIFAMRRYLPVVVPGLLLATAWVARQLAARARVLVGRVTIGRTVGRVLAAVVVLAVLAWPFASLRHLWSTKDKAGALAGNETVCAHIDHRPTVVTGVDTYLPTVLVLCDVPAASIPNPTRQLLTEAYRELGGGSIALVTRAPGGVPWAGGKPPAQVTFPEQEWEQSLTGPPDETTDETMGISVGRVQPDGSVAPVAP